MHKSGELMKRRSILFFLLFYISMPAIAEKTALKLGIFPYVSSSKLINHNKGVQKYINESPQFKISLVSAKDVPTYIKKVKAFDYDLIFCAPHLARYFEKKYAYQRVAMTSHNIVGIYLVKKDSPIYSLEELKEKNISLTPEKSIVHQVVLKQLKEYNIVPGKNLDIIQVKTHNNAIYNVLNDISSASITGIKLWKNFPAEKKNKLRSIGKTEAISGFIVLAKPDLDEMAVVEIQKLLLSFKDSKAGGTYIFNGFKLITDSEMQSLDAYAEVFE